MGRIIGGGAGPRRRIHGSAWVIPAVRDGLKTVPYTKRRTSADSNRKAVPCPNRMSGTPFIPRPRLEQRGGRQARDPLSLSKGRAHRRIVSSPIANPPSSNTSRPTARRSSDRCTKPSAAATRPKPSTTCGPWSGRARSPTTRFTRCAPSRAPACRVGGINGRLRRRSARAGWRPCRQRDGGRWYLARRTCQSRHLARRT